MTSMYEQVDTNTADPVAGSRIVGSRASWLLVNGAHGGLPVRVAAHSRADIVVYRGRGGSPKEQACRRDNAVRWF